MGTSGRDIFQHRNAINFRKKQKEFLTLETHRSITRYKVKFSIEKIMNSRLIVTCESREYQEYEKTLSIFASQ